MIFRKNLLNVACVLIFYTTSIWNISNSKKSSERIPYIYVGINVTYLLLSEVNETWIFLTEFSGKKLKKLKYKVLWKFVQWESSCPWGRTSMTKQVVYFCSFANAPKTYRDGWGVKGFPPVFFLIQIAVRWHLIVTNCKKECTTVRWSGHFLKQSSVLRVILPWKKMWFAFLNWFDEVSRDLESIYWSPYAFIYSWKKFCVVNYLQNELKWLVSTLQW